MLSLNKFWNTWMMEKNVLNMTEKTAWKTKFIKTCRKLRKLAKIFLTSANFYELRTPGNCIVVLFIKKNLSLLLELFIMLQCQYKSYMKNDLLSKQQQADSCQSNQ